MSSYVNINLIRFEYRGSWFAESPGQIKEKMPVMWENEYNRKTHILKISYFNIIVIDIEKHLIYY